MHIKGVLDRIGKRPFDLYVAILIFLFGLYSLLDDHWPEDYHDGISLFLIQAVSAYMMVAAVLVIVSLLCNPAKRPLLSLLGEMWGWLAIAAASSATAIMFIYMQFVVEMHYPVLAITMLTIWIGLSVSSVMRSLDIHLVLKGKR